MYDVTIIGAGLAGLQLARLLARGGASVLLADSRRSVTDCVRTTGIFVRRTFEDFSILDRFLGPPIRTIGVHSPSGRTIELSAHRDEFRVGRMKPLYEAMLQQAIAAGARWGPSMAYARCTPNEVFFRDGSSVKTRFIAGADGAHSRVARDLGLDRNHRWIAGVENVYTSALPGAPRFDVWIDPAIAPGYLAWVVDDGEEMHVGTGGDPHRFNAAAALAVFERRLGLPRPTVLECRGGFIPVNGVLRRIANDRGLLVGDAAGAVSPLTAGGLDACMRLSSHAAAILLATLRGDSALEAYDGSAFRTRFASRIAMRHAFDLLTRSRLAIEAGFLVARPMARHIFFGPGSFPTVEHRVPIRRRV